MQVELGKNGHYSRSTVPKALDSPGIKLNNFSRLSSRVLMIFQLTVFLLEKQTLLYP